MKFTLCSSSSELRCPFVEGLPRCINKNMLAPGLPVKVDNFVKENAQASNHDTRKLVMSSNLMPRRIKESRLGKKQLEEPGRKLEYVRTLLIDNYDSYTYNIYQELSVINGLPPVVVRNDELSWKDVCHYLYEENAFDNIVISPGPGSPTCPADIGQKQKQEVQLSCLFCRADNLNFVPKEKYISSMVQGCNDVWHHLHDEKDVQSINFCPFAQFVGSIGICLQVLLDCWNVPILGVCLGHQALGYVHGAKVVHASEPVHGRLSEIQHNGCVLFNDIPSGHNSGFKVVRYHSLVIDAESLPDELIPIAWTSSVNALSFIETKESNVASKSTDAPFSMKHNFFTYSPSSHSGKVQSERVLMGIMHSSRPHYGVQFHPESIATCHGRQIFKNFRKITENYWLRSSASLIDAQNYPFTARMQMPHVGHLLTDVPKHRQLLNNADGHLYKDADNVSCSGMVDMVNLLHPSITVKDLRLKWKKLKHLAGQVGGARNIFCELYGQEKAENTFWLDSSSIEKRRARFSFMGGKGGALWKQVTFKLSDKSDTTLKGRGLLSVQDAQGSIKRSFLEEGFLDFLKKELLSFCYDEKEYEELPFDFYGGYIGYLGYNLKVECGVDSNRHRSQTPDACFFFADNLVVVDHRNDDVYILSVDEVCTPLTPWLDDTEQKLLNLKASATGEGKKRTLTALRSLSGQGTFLGDKSREAYIEDVDKCLEYIKDGESYELCLTTQMRKRIGDIDSLGLYLHLREKNPAPYAAWLNFSDEDLSICCSSPERFLQLDRNGVLEAKPIKGTVARGATPEEDEQRKLQLQYSEKDQAENLMIVDLLRNDLGRVCEPGSVHVPRLMDVESYATVHTMVSTIRGQKRSDMTAIDCVRAAFPGGSMTGAPKLRSMELLDSIESSSRGIYSGSIGFFSYNQTFDLNIVIRTVVIHKGEASIGAGGAIVALSNPEDEYEEMVLKTRAPAKAVLEFL